MKQFFKRYYPYIKQYKLYFFFAIVGMILASAGTAGVTYIMKPLIDKIFVDKDMSMLYILPPALIIIFLVKSLGVYTQTYFMSYIGLDIVRKVRNDMLDHLLSLEMAFFNKKRNGELISRITNDINVIRAGVSHYITDFAREILTIIGLVAVIIYQSPILAIIGLIIMPLAAIPINIIVKKLKKVARASQETNQDITSRLTEIFNNVEIIKASNGETIESKNFKDGNMRFFKLTMKSTRISQLVSPLMEVLGAIAIAIVVIVGAFQTQHGTLTTGGFFSFLTAMLLIYTPIKRVLASYAAFQEVLVAGDRIGQILDVKAGIKDGKETLSPPVDSIKLENVVLHYDDFAALNGVNLSFAKDEITAIIGKSGAGKSSLVSLLLRLYDASSGSIAINGVDIKNFTQTSLRDNIAIVTQRIFIFHDTIASNVAYGSEINKARVEEALKIACAWEFVSSLEEGMETVLDEFGSNLSGGQRQRIAIARAIYKNPDVLILDEATSALDSQTELAIKEALERIKKGKIIILIAHRPSTISLAHKIVYMSEGSIKAIYSAKEYEKISSSLTYD
ncbi:ABC transporter ATP-binding protein [Helicobacter sp. 11S02629-2]|uniref:ABC transporter ATP-binding protein n=1 Tax=Helicobacter sp. 11S02629-2 TaxID=1476195 RepID=UPI000BA5D254|nr:ABC transporter ATP-binding protein [Helicobacter sp. 11S02629-2]PAF43489.1 ABC transporter permease [Helicobacter sp. 11S02629-2]